MATLLRKSVVREVDAFLERGRAIVVKMTSEGIYIKRKGERWSSAVLCPWGGALSTAYKIKALEDQRNNPRRRRVSRGLL